MTDRIVSAHCGVAAAMSYKYRARIESRERVTWFGFGSPITEWRAVIEVHFMAWQDDYRSCWFRNKDCAIAWGHSELDGLSSAPDGEYITLDSKYPIEGKSSLD